MLKQEELMRIFGHLDNIKDFTLGMRREIRVPRSDEVYKADTAVDTIREILYRAAMIDVEIEDV
jgi:hypothetical protein